MANKDPNVGSATSSGAAPVGSCGASDRAVTGSTTPKSTTSGNSSTTADMSHTSSGSSSTFSATSHTENRESAAGAQEAAGQVREKAKEATEHVMSAAQHKAKSLFADQKERAAEGLGGVMHAFRQIGDQMREKDQHGIAEYADRAADRVEYLSDYIRNNDVRDFLDDAQSMARNQPGLFIGSAFALGFLVARFLKSSSQGISRGGMGRHYGFRRGDQSGHRYGIPPRSSSGGEYAPGEVPFRRASGGGSWGSRDEHMVGEVPTYGSRREIRVREER